MIAGLGPNLPHEALAATGRYAGPLAIDADRATPRANLWVESKFMPWARPALEAWAEGELDHLEAVVFSRADDTSQRLYYYVCELQRRGLLAGPQALIFDVAKVARPSSVARTRFALEQLCRRFCVNEEMLEGAIAESNRRRASTPAEAAGPNCLIAGTPPPDRRLHQAVEREGMAAWGDTLAEYWRRPGPAVEEVPGRALDALAAQLSAFPHGPRAFADPATALLDTVRRRRARAVVLWRIEEDEAHAWHLPAERRALEAAGVPALILSRRDWRARDGAAQEIGRFLQEFAARAGEDGS